MKVLCILIVFVVFLYFSDMIVTRKFCTLKKKYDEKNSRTYIVSSAERQQNSPKSLLKKVGNIYSGWIRYKLRRLGNVPCHWYRKFILRNIYLMQLDSTSVVYGGFEIRSPWNISIGSGTIIGDEAKLDGRNGIIIGSNVNFSTGVWIWTDQHDINDPDFKCNDKGGKVVVENRAWLSARTTILPKVTIGEGAVIAAGAVVTKDCESYSVYGGIPAKKISERNRDLKYEFTGSHVPFY